VAADGSEQFVLLNRLADEFAERYRRGERPRLEEYIDRHPELADDIREFFPAMVEMEQVKEERQAVSDLIARGPLPALERLGDFRIIREIGHGGMGVVYEAEQVSLGRHVALKVLPKQLLVDGRTKRRFEREARAAAKLHHTNIVPVFGVGEHEGLPYYAMQYIQGMGLDAVIEELGRLQRQHGGGSDVATPQSAAPSSTPTAPAPARDIARSLMTGAFQRLSGEDALVNPESPSPSNETGNGPKLRAFASADLVISGSASGAGARLDTSSASSLIRGGLDSSGSGKRRRSGYWHSVARLGLQVADALEYAHKQGIHHRDIKPSNLLLDTQGTVWVTDFGLAKTDDQQNLTHTGDILGTLRYMSPEAFEGKTDARSDIYSLGLTLYEMLAFRPAFDEKDRKRLIKQVTTTEPPRLDTLNRAIPRDLVTIVQKASDHERERRYATAGELAADLQRYLADEPIQARRQTHLERYVRWARHNRGVAAALAAIAVILVAVAVGSGIAAVQFRRLAVAADEERDKAEQSADEARRRSDAERWQRYRSNLAAAGSALQLQSSGAARRALQAAPAEYRDWEWLHFTSRLDEARLVLSVGSALERDGESVAFRPDGKQVAAGQPDGTVRVWDAATGREVGSLPAQGQVIRQLAFSPDGRRLLVFYRDGTLQSWDPAANDRQVLLRISYIDLLMGDLLSPDQRFLVGIKDLTVQLWDVATGRKRADLPGRLVNGLSCASAFSTRGRRFAYSTEDHAIHVWDLDAGAEVQVLRGHASYIRALAFSPDGKRLASGSMYPENSARLWDVTTGKEINVLHGHQNEVVSVGFSPDGTRLASASLDQTTRLWDGVTGREIATLQGHRGQVQQVAFRPDGRHLVSSSFDGTLRLWESAGGEPVAVLHGHASRIWESAFSPDGALLASASADGTVRLWDMALAERSGVLRGHTSYVYDVAFSPDGTRAASAGWDGTVRLWDPTSCLQTSPPLTLPQGTLPMISGVCFRPDGKQIVSANADGFLRVWDAASGKLLRKLRCPVTDWRLYARAAFDPGGTLLVAGGNDGLIRLWGAEGDQPVATLAGHEGVAGDVAFRPDGVQLASCGLDKTVRLWDVATRKPGVVLHGHGGTVTRVAYSADGRLLASASEDRTVRLWDATTGEALAVLPHGSIVYGVAFNPSGTRLAAGCADNTIRLWDVGVARRAGDKEAPDAEVAELRGHDAYVHAVDWSPDGTRLISASGDGTVRIWDSLPPAVRARPPDVYVPPRGYVCYRATGPIAIDGKLDDAAWQAVPWTENFVDIEGDRRLPPHFRTRAKMLWDDQYFYIGAELEEPHVQGSFTKRDSFIFHEDNDFEVFLNPDGNNHNYAELEMNALNTVWDLRLKKPYRDQGEAEHDWDIPGLKTAVHVNGTVNNPRDIDQGWTIEIAIPWEIVPALKNDQAAGSGDPRRTAARPPRDGEQWRVNFSRVEWRFDIADGKYVRRKDRREDNWVWSPQGVVNMHQTETWGYVQFSAAPPGKAAFHPDPAGPAKHVLHRIYYAQRSFHKDHGRYANSLAELKLAGISHETLAAPPQIGVKGDGFEASAEIQLPNGKRERWRIRQDSLVWPD
jgi:WD40 repeat protein/serine/threonine protein kinase